MGLGLAEPESGMELAEYGAGVEVGSGQALVQR